MHSDTQKPMAGASKLTAHMPGGEFIALTTMKNVVVENSASHLCGALPEVPRTTPEH